MSRHYDPIELTGGRWILRGNVQHWEPNGPPPEPPPQIAIPDACRDCERELSTLRHGGRGLCKACYAKHRKAETIDQYPRFRRTWNVRRRGNPVDAPFHLPPTSGTLAVAKDERPRTADRANGRADGPGSRRTRQAKDGSD